MSLLWNKLQTNKITVYRISHKNRQMIKRVYKGKAFLVKHRTVVMIQIQETTFHQWAFHKYWALALESLTSGRIMPR